MTRNVTINYRAVQTENAKSMSYQGLSQRGINEKSVCIRGRSAKQHGHDGQNNKKIQEISNS
jgi:hypothetical protein